ncbi:hypothetical protein O6H91_13G097400 [Diphasiastrum complanatum]|uniref:Uncharacterized protein n=1 Tax=Diphasiastrum complanatum TaxID=34168 RepID=A0ACC2BXK6_DIPCM|nr:hypothetical protein O6H91_13G097400 [Diphasiastrum complanatum]
MARKESEREEKRREEMANEARELVGQHLNYSAAFICSTCGIQFPPPAEIGDGAPPSSCLICCEERQFVPRTGQVWTTQSKMKHQYRNGFQKHEAGMYSIATVPKFAIGQRAFLLQTSGNLLWDCVSFLDEATIDIVNALGGLKAIAISHPHYYSTNAQWSAAFGGIPVYIHERDKKWSVWEHERITFWRGDELHLWGGLTLLNLGGHFAGAQVLHWAGGAEGKGVLLTGDILQVSMDNATISIMRSYPNYIPLSASHAQRIGAKLNVWEFDRIYGAFLDREIETGAKSKVSFSLQRYIKWLNSTDLEI